MAEALAHRCLNHSEREAAARCPSCAHFFCRECVTEHDGRVICARCLRAESAVVQDRRLPIVALGRCVAVVAGFVLGWLCFYSAGQLLVSVPAKFHDGALWQVPFLEQK